MEGIKIESNDRFKNKVLTIDDVIETLQKAKTLYGNLPIDMDIDNTIKEKDIYVWDARAIRYDDNSVTFYNF